MDKAAVPAYSAFRLPSVSTQAMLSSLEVQFVPAGTNPDFTSPAVMITGSAANAEMTPVNNSSRKMNNITENRGFMSLYLSFSGFFLNFHSSGGNTYAGIEMLKTKNT